MDEKVLDKGVCAYRIMYEGMQRVKLVEMMKWMEEENAELDDIGEDIKLCRMTN